MGVTRVLLPEFSLTVDTSKFSFVSSAMYVQKALSAEIKLWQSFEDLNWSNRLLAYLGTQATRLTSKILKDGLNVELPGFKLEINLPQKLEAPQEEMISEVTPDFIIEPSINEMEGQLVLAEYIEIEKSAKENLEVFPILSRVEEIPNTSSIGIDTAYYNVPFKDLQLQIDPKFKSKKTFSQSMMASPSYSISVVVPRFNIITFLLGFLFFGFKLVRKLYFNFLLLIYKKEKTKQETETILKEAKKNTRSRRRI